MSSHHEWAEEVISRHDAEKPFAPENGDPLRFAIGDPVIFTNDAGVSFDMTITGFYRPAGGCSLYARGFRYLVNSSSPWMPVKESSLRPASDLNRRLAAAKGAGRMARAAGQIYAACPYPAGAIERSAWHQGWTEEDNAKAGAAPASLV